ncbi:hypothetical protein [Neisseria animaloris]|uniref:hypothetical protein n=1 Tax=Neisseria animaloris TaxID=326522 RepID=UPI00131CCD8C|nr:hypothetical protein [Neisseria animaloris]
MQEQIYIALSWIGIIITFLGLLIVFLGTHELMKLLKTKSYRFPTCYILVFVCIVFQVYSLSICKQFSAIYHFLLMVSLIVSAFIILWTFATSLRENTSENKLLEASLVLGIFQVAVSMVIASDSRSSVQLKLIANMIYLSLPALALYELPKLARRQKKNKITIPYRRRNYRRRNLLKNSKNSK